MFFYHNYRKLCCYWHCAVKCFCLAADGEEYNKWRHDRFVLASLSRAWRAQKTCWKYNSENITHDQTQCRWDVCRHQKKKKWLCCSAKERFWMGSYSEPPMSAIKGLLVPTMQLSSVLKIPLEDQENWRHSRSVCFCENKEIKKNNNHIYIYIYI